MVKTSRSWSVDQGWLLSPSMHEFVPPGHLAHFVRDTVREVARRVAVIYDGRIVEMGSARSVYDTPAHPFTQMPTYPPRFSSPRTRTTTDPAAAGRTIGKPAPPPGTRSPRDTASRAGSGR
jgi:hypothetical protein